MHILEISNVSCSEATVFHIKLLETEGIKEAWQRSPATDLARQTTSFPASSDRSLCLTEPCELYRTGNSESILAIPVVNDTGQTGLCLL